MARYERGYVKAHRLPADHWLEEKGQGLCWSIFMKLCQWANVEDDSPSSRLQLKRGQLATSSLELVEYFDIGRQRVRTVLARLEHKGSINQRANQHGTIITICNYDKHNPRPAPSQPTGQPEGNQRVTNDQPLTEELKNKRKKNVPSADALGPDLVDLGRRWLAFALAQTPTGAENANWTEIHFAVEIDKIIKNLSITIIQANELFDFIQSDHDFWAKNAISPFGLLKRSKNGLRKAENVMNAMRRNPVQKTRATGTNVVQIKPLTGGYE